MRDQEKASVRIAAGEVELEGELSLPAGARGVVLFAHGSGSSRHSRRNRYVAGVLNEARLGTLLFDLLTAEEEAVDMRTSELRFDIGLLAERLLQATDWLVRLPGMEGRKIGYFGASTGAGAALEAAAKAEGRIGAVVSRGGRPDLAAQWLARVEAATLLIVGGEDGAVIEFNRRALERLGGEKRLEIVAGATHLFAERGALEEVGRLAREWFVAHLDKTPG